MKHFTLDWLINSRVRETIDPKPFPGRYPTKIAVRVSVDKKNYHEYLGAPSQNIAKAVMTLLKLGRPLYFWVGEFDRGGLIATSGGFWSNGKLFLKDGGTQVGVHGNNRGLQFYYHPQESTYTFFGYFASVPPSKQVRKVNTGKRIIKAYFPVQPVSRLGTLEPYKLWLRERGLD